VEVILTFKRRIKMSVSINPLKHIVLMITVITYAVGGAPRDPFPPGHSMPSQGAIIDPDGATGREPWAGAALYRDTLPLCVSASAISYHGGGSVSQYAIGGLAVLGPIISKVSITHLDALKVYYEQTAGLSVGNCRRYLSYSIETRLYRLGLYGSPNDTRSSISIGAVLCLRTTRVIADAAIDGITVMSAETKDTEAPMSVTARLCTVRNRYGTQGAMVKITPTDESPLRFVLAQEYRIGDLFAVSASIASNPTTIGFGITVDKFPLCGGASVVNHPDLGWSSGMAADWRGRVGSK